MRTNPIIAILSAAALPISTQAFAKSQGAGPAPASHNDQSGEVFVAADYQQGNYGTGAKVETVSTSVGIALRKKRVRLTAAIPYLRTTAPVDAVVSQGGLFGTPLFASSSSQALTTRREGLGDATVQAGYDMPVASFVATISGGIKLPTASRAKGLGTGKVDYATNVQIARSLSGGITPFATVGYTILGKPEGFAVRNTLSASAGTRAALSSRSFALLSYSYEQSASPFLADRQSIGAGLGLSLGKKLQLGLQGDAGANRGAPEMKLGVRLGAGF